MVRKAAFLLCLALLVSVSAKAQDNDKYQVFGGYSYQRADATPSFNQNGWEVAFQYKFSKYVGLVVDTDGHYGQLQGSNSSTYTYLFGPQISAPGKFSPFVQGLVGGANQHFSGNFNDQSVAWTVGVGADYRIAPGMYVRIVQIGVEPTYFFNSAQYNVRLSTGFVLKF